MRLVSWSNWWPIPESISCTLEKNEFPVVLGETLYLSVGICYVQLIIHIIVWFLCSSYCSSHNKSGVLVSLAIIFELLIYHFIFIARFYDCCVFLMGWPFYHYEILSLVTVFVLKSIMSAVSTAYIPISSLLIAWHIFYPSFNFQFLKTEVCLL